MLNIKKIIRINLLIIVFIIYINVIAATSEDVVSDIGIVTLNLVNRPPVITDIYFNPEIVYEDSKLGCVVDINDEKPDEITLIYKWYVNNGLTEINKKFLTGFNENDIVRCEVTPIDNENVIGETKNITTTINKNPFLSAITGFVIKNYKTNISLSLTLFYFAAIIAIFIIIFFKALDINILIKKYIK